MFWISLFLLPNFLPVLSSPRRFFFPPRPVFTPACPFIIREGCLLRLLRILPCRYLVATVASCFGLLADRKLGNVGDFWAHFPPCVHKEGCTHADRKLRFPPSTPGTFRLACPFPSTHSFLQALPRRLGKVALPLPTCRTVSSALLFPRCRQYHWQPRHLPYSYGKNSTPPTPVDVFPLLLSMGRKFLPLACGLAVGFSTH